MQLPPFELERYFARHEFSARYLLSSSDCEALSLGDLLSMADENSRNLWETLKLGYTESSGHPRLRSLIADQYDGLAPEDILVVTPEEGVFLSMQALLKTGDHVVCTFPGYQSLYDIPRALGCRVSLWQPEETDCWQFDLDRLKGLLQPDTRLVVVNFPHNPTGAKPSPEMFTALIDLLKQRGVALFSDEMYRHLEIPPGRPLPAASTQYEGAVSLGGLSKSYGLPGLRIGWLATRNRKFLVHAAHLKDYTTICASAPGEILAIMALGCRKSILARQHERLLANLDVLETFMRDHEEVFGWRRPAGGSICFPSLRRPEGAAAFCGTLVEKAGIMLLPSTPFQFGDRHVRIGFGRSNLPEVLERLAAYLASDPSSIACP